MSYHCNNSDCDNYNAQLPASAAEKFGHRCFLCDLGELILPELTLEGMVKEVDSLPVALQILPRLKVLLNDDNSSMGDIVNVTRTDASLVTQLIKISNSAIYSLAESRSCNTIEESLNRIGFNTAYRVVGYVAAKQVFQKDLEIYDITGLGLWELSVRTGNCMQRLSASIQASSDSYVTPDDATAYTVGLLHPIGKMLVNHYHETRGIPAITDADYPLTEETEKARLGFTHRDAAAKLLALWNFQEEVSDPIRFQSNPMGSKGDRPLACLLSIVSEAVLQFPVGSDTTPKAMVEKFKPNKEHAAIVGISKTEIIQALAESAEECSHLARSLSQ